MTTSSLGNTLPATSRWRRISSGVTGHTPSILSHGRLTPSLAPVLNSTRASLSEKVRNLAVQGQKPQGYDFAKVVSQLQTKNSLPPHLLPVHGPAHLLPTTVNAQREINKQLSGNESETEQPRKMLTYLLYSQHSLRSREMEVKMKQQSAKICTLKRKVSQLEATVAHLKKAVTMMMAEQSRQQLVNRRLQESMMTQHKRVMTSQEETRRLVQQQRATLSHQDLKGLRCTNMAHPSVIHGVCAVATWYIMHSAQYKILFNKIHKLLCVRRSHRKWVHLLASLQIFYVLRTMLPSLPLFTSRFWFAMSSTTNPPTNRQNTGRENT